MRSIVLSNIPHYHHLAQALHQAGLLSGISRPGAARGRAGAHSATGEPSGAVRAAALHGVPKDLVRQLRWPEILQRLMPATWA